MIIPQAPYQTQLALCLVIMNAWIQTSAMVFVATLSFAVLCSILPWAQYRLQCQNHRHRCRVANQVIIIHQAGNNNTTSSLLILISLNEYTTVNSFRHTWCALAVQHYLHLSGDNTASATYSAMILRPFATIKVLGQLYKWHIIPSCGWDDNTMSLTVGI